MRHLVNDLTGTKVGRLKVVAPTNRRSPRGEIIWECLCDCGHTAFVRTGHLRDDSTSSCGCLRKEVDNITEQRFGRLIALEFYEQRNRRAFWKCLCDCGEMAIVSVSSLRNGGTQSCGCLNKEGRFGEGNSNWRGGVPRVRPEYESRRWRTEVKVRDNYTCQKCGINENTDIHAHHIKNFSSCIESRYDVDNGITFCEECHTTFHKTFGYYSNNMDQIIQFLIGDSVAVLREKKK